MEKSLSITPNQCRAARELLNWKQSDLGEKSKVAIATIGFFERGVRNPMPRTLRDLRETFEAAGIRFESSEKEVVVRLLLET